MPHTKPHLQFNDDGVCDACRHYEEREEVDWNVRKQELIGVLDKYRSKDGSNWDCVIPVSGGKDSTYQVIRMLQLGMNPLCVTGTTCDLSEVGRKNIENLQNLGVDYIEVTTNRIVRRKLNRIGLKQIGDISWPEHISINTIPIRVAVQYGIKLIIWGENSQNEYGGPASASDSDIKTWEWLLQFAGFVGLRTSDLIGVDGIRKRDMIPFTYPTKEELSKVGVTGLFLGYYLPWDGYSNALLAQAHGFSTLATPVEGSLVNYENLDNHQTGIHDYFKYLKFGWGRATDILSMAIRRKKITRSKALEIIKEREGKYPSYYLKKSLKNILSDINMTIEEFDVICDKFTNKDLFLCNNKGNLIKDEHKNLIKKKYDN